MEALDCGCLMGTAVIDGERTFVFEPCSTSCPAYDYVLRETNEQGIPRSLRHVKE